MSSTVLPRPILLSMLFVVNSLFMGMSAPRYLKLKGVRQNNLKNIDLELPLGRAIVITGPSGSGKSSLAFDTIYAEGQRRYMQSLSTYARQFLEKFRAPLVEEVHNIPPTIALEQSNPVRNSRATVGTTTEIYDYLRLLFEKLGVEYCETCGIPMERLSFEGIYRRLTSSMQDGFLLIGYLAKVPSEGAQDFLAELLRNGYPRVLIGSTVERVETLISRKTKLDEIQVIVDRMRLGQNSGDTAMVTRVTEALQTAMRLGNGFACAFSSSNDQYASLGTFTTQATCPQCGKMSAPKSAISFSFNSPLGACEACKGFGNTLEVDLELAIPNPNLSLSQGAIDPFTKPSLRHWQKRLLSFCAKAKIDVRLPYRELREDHRLMIFQGTKGFRGVKGVFQLLERDKYKLRIRVFISRYKSAVVCAACRGSRLNAKALRVKLAGLSIADICQMTLGECHSFIKTLPLVDREREIATDILRQIGTRLEYLNTVGLGYLTLSRLTRSLSGGEYQRILLGTQLSHGLTDTLYVLDEPSIGLHVKDTKQLISVLNGLREQGNSLILVEHDPEIIQWGEHIIDLGPGAGNRGGQVVFSGSREHFLLSGCPTAQAVQNWKEQCRAAIVEKACPDPTQWIEIHGARENNLKDLDVKIPLRCLVAITGVSGSGKSTLIVDTLYGALAKIFRGESGKIGKFDAIRGFEYLEAVELVDQSPIGKSSRSNPITFIKAFDEIRRLFASTQDATAKNLTPGNFSFNVPGGRCDVCDGEGRIRVDMVFMEDVWLPCQACDEKRFKPLILSVRYQGRNIDDCLRMTVDDAYDFFKTVPTLKNKLATLQEVGLGYLQLGQPGYTLSGGEAQRLKITRSLTNNTRLPRTLFILDEPTTGLHFSEIIRLIAVLNSLVTAGHSVVVIEHNLQMICAAHFVIDLGPDGGEQGGRVVAVGTPRELAEKKLPYTGIYLSEFLH